MDVGDVEHMNYKLVGSICVIVACGGAGLMMAMQYVSRIRVFADMIILLNYMENEIQYRRTPLPLLCRQAAEQVSGKLRLVFVNLANELDAQIAPNVELCMLSVLDKLSIVDVSIRATLLGLSNNLGKFDAEGQLKALEYARSSCSENLKQLQIGREQRIRGYQTLGLCAGAAIAILFV